MPHCDVVDAGCVAIERFKPEARVLIARGIVERKSTRSAVVVAGDVVNERTKTAGRIFMPGGVAKECLIPSGSVVVPVKFL